MEDSLREDFKSQTRDFFSHRVEYDIANCLMIKWAETDFPADRFEREFKKVRDLLGEKLTITPKVFEIPVGENQAQKGLNLEVATFVHQYSQHTRSLIIIYYAGHGDRDPQGRAEWMAKEQGGPTVSWASASQNLTAASGDVLVLLDCCHGALYDGRSKSQGKYEVLAATTKDFPNPHYTNMVQGGAESINLCHVRSFSIPSEFRRRSTASGSITLQVELAGGLKSWELIRWLQTYCPLNVTAIQIEKLVQRARRLQNIPDTSDAKADAYVFSNLSDQARTEVHGKLHDLSVVLSQSFDAANNAATSADATAAHKSLVNIEEGIESASRAIETPLLLEFGGLATSEALVETIGAPISVSLRRQLMSEDTPADDLEIKRDLVDLPENDHRLRCATYGGQDVLVEAFSYQPELRTAEPFKKTLLQVRKMASLLHQDKESFYHILPGLGYVREPHHDRIALVFKIPESFKATAGPVLLLDLYAHSEFKRVALDNRLSLAKELVVAVEHLHRLEWLHKEFRSNNIFFLKGNDGSDRIDFHCPWLCGFEYARKIDEGTKMEEDYEIRNNLYRHPDRWGKPQKRFTRAHDLYSLGVVLLEIFTWRSAEKIVGRSPTGESGGGKYHRNDAKDCFLRIAATDLPHLVGQSLSNVVRSCLEFDSRTHGVTDYETQLFFQKEILDRIVESAKRFV